MMAGRPKGKKDTKRRKTRSYWTSAELQYLKDNHFLSPMSHLEKKLNKSDASIRAKAKKLNLVKRYFYQRERDVDFIQNNSGVYGIYNSTNNYIYIGSSIDMKGRLRDHICALNNKRHYNTSLQNDWNQFSFDYVVLFQCVEKELLKYEHKFIKGWPYLYNTNPAFVKIPRFDESDKKRIYSKIQKEKGGCWLWTGYCKTNAYPVVRLNNKHFVLHRVIFKLEKGIDPGDNVVRHMCNNKKCCNPEHLKLGSYSENNKDTAKGFLLEDKREQIWCLYQKYGRVTKIAEHLGEKYNRVISILHSDKRYKKKWVWNG